MEHSEINTKKKDILSNPCRGNVESLLQALRASSPGFSDKNIEFLKSLFSLSNEPQDNTQLLSFVNGKSSDGTKTGNAEPHRVPDPNLKLLYLKILATDQLSIINGLGDIEWIQDYFVRQCLNDKLVHIQALPSLRKFGISITGKFTHTPNAYISQPFHPNNYIVTAAGRSEKNEWTTHYYECELLHNERLDNVKENILYELVIDTTAGDYMLDISYFF